MLTKDTLVSAAQGPVAAALGEEMALLDVDSGRYFAFNPIGTDLWCWMQTPTSFGTLLERIQTEYAVDEATCARDLQVWLERLQSRGLVEIRRPDGRGN
ncbi:MAG: PqqD family protein [Chromatiaceae bacterium]|jgi:hypothetical protein|nr:PqqD family protein [Candidatus Thioaporhodococcus sediminis]